MKRWIWAACVLAAMVFSDSIRAADAPRAVTAGSVRPPQTDATSFAPAASAITELDAEAGTAVGVSPDGTKIAVVSPGISLCVLDSATREEMSCASLADAAISVRLDDVVWSPDGTRIAFSEMGFILGTDSDLWVMDATSGGLTNLTDDGFAGSIYALDDDDPAASAEFFVDASPAWTPDGDYLSFSRTGYVNGKSTGNVLARVPTAGVAVEELLRVSELEPGVVHYRSAWSPDGATLYYSLTSALLLDEEDGIWAFDTATGTTAPIATYDGSNLGPPALLAVSPVGDSLLIWYPTAIRNFTLSETLIRLIDLETGAIDPPWMPLLAPTAVRGLTQGAFSPDGTAMLLLVDGAEENGNELWTLDLASEELTLVLEDVPDPLYDGGIALSWGANGTVVIGLQEGGAVVTEITGIGLGTA
jgi:sugar lactone lactonase YvrE